MIASALHPCASFWLVAAREEAAAAAADNRYLQAAAAQKIFFDPLSITQDLRLEAAFEALATSAPSVDQAHTVFRAIEREIPHYAFEAEQDIWHIRNRSKPAFGDPLLGERWVLFARLPEGATQRVELEGSEVAEAFAWLPLLDGHHTAADVLAGASHSPAALRVHAAFEAIGALLVEPEEDFRIEDLPEMTFVSHSSVFIRGREASILIDPAILTSTELLSKPGRRPFELATKTSAVLVSHFHWDHLSFQTMLRIPRETKMIVPRCTGPSLANPPLRTYLEAFGFRNVVEVSDWDELTIGDLQVTFVPFFGEPFGLGSRFDAYTYLVRVNGKTIYGSLDACHDEVGNMDPVFAKLGDDHAVDVFLFGSSSQRHEPLYRGANMRHYSNELLRRPDLVRYHPNIDDVIRWCGPLRPKSIIPYANFVYFGAEQFGDERFDDGSNVARYWAGVESQGVPPVYQTWRSELDRLTRSVANPLVMLHPMQGLRF